MDKLKEDFTEYLSMEEIENTINNLDYWECTEKNPYKWDFIPADDGSCKSKYRY